MALPLEIKQVIVAPTIRPGNGVNRTNGLTCVTEEDFVKAGKLKDRHTVDHICVDNRLVSRVTAVGAWEREGTGGLRMSDHSGVWLEAALA